MQLNMFWKGVSLLSRAERLPAVLTALLRDLMRG